MTCFECEKCGARTPDFEQDTAYYDQHGNLIQIFRCTKCGEEKHIDARFSAVILPTCEVNVYASFWEFLALKKRVEALERKIE